MLPVLLVAALVAPDTTVGLQAFQAAGAAPAETVPALVWYPSQAPARDTTIGLRPMRVAYGAPLAPATTPYPIVLLSHGTGGSESGHADLALALARAGFVVISVRHPGDNFQDASGLGTDVQFYGRSHHLVQALNALLARPEWAAHLDARRVGFVGYSAGGYTGLTLLGAQPDFHRLAGYCTRYPGDENYCHDGLRGRVELNGTYRAPAREARLRAAVLLAPALAFLFDSVTLARIQTPILVYRAADDDVVREPDNALWLARHLSGLVDMQSIPHAGHFVFLAPCSPALAARLPSLCADPPGVDRVLIHEAMDARIVAFMQRQLEASPN